MNRFCGVCPRNPALPSFRRSAAETWKQLGLPKLPQNRRESGIRSYQKNREKIREVRRRFYIQNRTRLLLKTAEYFRINKDKRLPQRRYHKRSRYKTDFLYRLSALLRSRLTRALRPTYTKVDKTLCLLGCSLAHLKSHLEKQFKPGMIWENHGPVWHIDHIRPCASFNLAEPEQQKICFHYSNLQPLFAEENIRKGKTMPNLKPAEPTEVVSNPPPSSPFNYQIDEESERQKVLDRATDKVENFPGRPIL